LLVQASTFSSNEVPTGPGSRIEHLNSKEMFVRAIAR